MAHKTIPGYVISEEISRGRKNIVYRGTRELDNRKVILKTLTKENPSNSEVANLKREYEIIKNLDHEYIIEAFDFVSNKSRPTIVLEDIGGESLRFLIDNGQIDFNTHLEIAIKLAEALAYLHKNNIIHKDINPKNIIVNLETAEFRVIDFSISTRLLRDNQKISHPVHLEGSLAYISPEQTGRMNRIVDYRTDFYSMGTTIYEMLTKQLPFLVQDPMELVHCHIAKVPLAPMQIKNDIPKAVSDIVMKMLAKTAEHRYQSALGIRADFQSCLSQWKASKKIKDLIPGEFDIKDRFQIPQKLYGRENEINALLSGFDRVARGKTEMLLISGYSGIGKSALVLEIHNSIIEKKGYFISGKFDQVQGTVPYSAITVAFRELMRLLLTEDEKQLGIWKEKLLSALGVNGQVIIDVIPEVELVIGLQPAIVELGPIQALNRFKLMFQNFIGVFCQKIHPLVIFLDDLQWVDSASLNLMELMMTNHDTRYLYLIGAYRDNEVTPKHPLMKTLALLKEEGATINNIVLEPLDLDNISQLVSESFERKDESVKQLVNLVMTKTNGNPFFLRQFLNTLFQEKLIYFDSKTLSWQWEITKIEVADITANVVDLMISKLKKMPESVQHILWLAACIGNRFDLNSLSIICEQSATNVSQNLWQAIQNNLVFPTSNFEEQISRLNSNAIINKPELVTFSFLHDRVQQAAYALIEESKKKIVHLKIGKLLLENLKVNEQDERLFELVDHLNVGRELLDNEKEKIELACLNLRAGIKAKEASAYDASKEYLIIGLDCLSDDRWYRTYDLSFDLNRNLAEAEYLTGQFENSTEVIREILEHSKTSIERAQIYNTLVVQQTLNGEYEKAIETGRKALLELKVDLPTENYQTALEDEIEMVKQNLGKTKIESLIELHEVTLPEIIIAQKLLASICPLCYIYNPELCRVSTLRLVNISLQHGHTHDSVLGYAFYGLFFSSFLRDYKSAYEFGQLAINLSYKFNSSVQKCRATHVFSAFINHWSRHLNFNLKINDEGFQAGLESGELQFAGYHRYNRALCLFYMGKNLQTLLPELIELLRFSEKTRNQHATDPIIAVQLATLNLTGRTKGKLVFKNDHFDNEVFEKDLLARNGIPGFTHYNVIKAFVFYLYGELHQALQCIVTTKDKLSFVQGHFSTAAHNFYHSLILSALYHQVPKKIQKEYWAQLSENQEQLKVWAENCPENFLNKYLLIAAEIARVSNKIWEASDLYDKSIEAARENQFIHEEALANELAAKFYLSNSREKLASVYFLEARKIYRKWGAIRKTLELEEEFQEYLSETVYQEPQMMTSTITHDLSTGSGTKTLDFLAVIKAAQTISSEIVLATLLEKLIGIVIENAGAQKGFIILDRDDELFIEAVNSVGSEELNNLKSTSLKTEGYSTKLPLSIINFVKRTKENILIADAEESSQFSKDPYIIQIKPKSILCLPILNKGNLIGILYLENNLISDAFKSESLEVIQILSAQSAISLQNARLYEEVKQLKNQLEAENIYLQEEIKLVHNFEEIISKSKKFKKILNQVEQVATTDANVLILGESGTGKELIARAIHVISKRKNRPMVKVNCAALPASLIESELFGHEKGAFTGALVRKIGRFELADGGSLFLDEIGEIPIELQPKLLRVLQEGEFERVGNSNTIKVNVRIIAATNVDLQKAIDKGTFREDLYYRLNVFPINIPPLRERKEDIPLLVHHFLSKYNLKFGKKIEIVSEKVINALMDYGWPGNIRELENVIERAVIISPTNKLIIANTFSRKAQETSERNIVTLAENERDYIIKILEQTNWRVSGERGAGKVLNINSTTLESKMKKLGIKRP